MRALRKPALLLILLASLFASATTATHGDLVGGYAGAGAIVVAPAGGGALTFVDNGAVTCADADGDGVYETGVGGTCVRFDRFDGYAVHVVDEVHGDQVAFQVCVDLNGDSVCGADAFTGGAGDPHFCPDLIFFSHESATGAYHNPLPVPSDAQLMWERCGSRGFPGFVVIACAGAHLHFNDGMPHTHEVTSGRVYAAAGVLTGLGDFCGGPLAAKAFVVQ